jgi:hypothetical protein
MSVFLYSCILPPPYYVVICALPGCTIFFDIITKTEKFKEKLY